MKTSTSVTRTAVAASAGRGPLTYLLLLLLLVNIAGLGYYLFYGYMFEFHSDSAAANLLAQEMYETRQYFPHDWNWANGDLWVVVMQTWILVLFPFFHENGFALHAAGGVIGCILTGLGTWGLCSILGTSTRTKLFALALLSAGLTPIMSEHIFGQQAYGTMYYVCCAILFTSWKFIHAQDGRRFAWAAASAVLVVLVAWANPQRALIYDVLPLLAALAAFYGAARADGAPAHRYAARLATLAALALLATFIGALLYKSTLYGRTALGGKIAIDWLEFPGMVDNIVRCLHGLVVLLGGTPKAGTPIATLAGVVDALRMVAALTLIAVAPFALGRCLRTAHRGFAFVATAGIASFATSLFIYLTSSLALSGAPELSIRYLVPGLLLLLVVIVAWLAHDTKAGLGKRAAAAAALGVLVLSAPFAYDLLGIPALRAAGGAERTHPTLRMVRFLASEGLHYGYASFWNAGRATVLSKGAVKIRQIQFDDAMPVPMRHLSSNRWYEPAAWRGRTFTLLTKDEMAKVDLAEMFRATGEPVRRLEFEGFQILVFDHNIANDFPTWRTRFTEPVSYRVTARTPHAIGRFDPAAGSLTADKGEAGALRFGPYLALPAGRYLVSFSIRTEGDAPANFGSVDVVADSGRKSLGARTVDALGTQRITVPVALDQVARAIEFRVFSSGAGKMSAFDIELENDNRSK